MVPEPALSDVTWLPGLPRTQAPLGLAFWPPACWAASRRPVFSIPLDTCHRLCPLEGSGWEASGSVWSFTFFLTSYPAPKRKELK